jgi:hypothetical protein
MVYAGPSAVRTAGFVGLLAVVALAVVGTVVVPFMVPLWMVLLIAAVAGFLLIAYRMWSCPNCGK